MREISRVQPALQTLQEAEDRGSKEKYISA